MSQRGSISLGARTGAERRRVATRTASPTADARRGTFLQAVREGSASVVLSALQRLEYQGHLTEDLTEREDVEVELEDEAYSPDLDMNDPDDIPSNEGDDANEEWVDETFVMGESQVNPSSGSLSDEPFPLIVAGDSCTFVRPHWTGCYVPRTSEGQQVLHELSVRFATLDRLAQWLQESRTAFLVSRDFWDLGPQDMTEVADGVAVLQKDLHGLLRLRRPISEASFSRFIRSSMIVWDDGVAPLSVIFSDEAKRAWVAKSVWLFSRGSLRPPDLDASARVRVQKGKAARRQLKETSIGSMDFQSFIEYANQRAGTKWSMVLEQYRDRMLTPHE